MEVVGLANPQTVELISALADLLTGEKITSDSALRRMFVNDEEKECRHSGDCESEKDWHEEKGTGCNADPD